MANLQLDINIHNKFDIEVIDAKTGKIKQQAQGFNIVCDNLWNYLCRSNFANKLNYFKCILYGSGTGTPSVNDVNLFTYEGGKICYNNSAGDSSSFSDDGITGCEYYKDITHCWISCKRSIQLSESEAVGVNITEVGIGSKNTVNSNALCTHAMLQDMNGNPISILKTNTDIINIYATIYVHWSSNQIDIFKPWYYNNNKAGSFRALICGTQGQGYYIDNYLWSYIPNTAVFGKESSPFYADGNNPILDRNQNNLSVTVTSDSATKKIIFTIPRVPVANLNVGGIGSVWLYNFNSYYNVTVPAIQCYMRDLYNGDNITNEAIGTGDGTTTSFATKFDFPENAKVYINGIEQNTGFTVKSIPCGQNIQLRAYMRYLVTESTDAVNIVDPMKYGDTSNIDTKTKHYSRCNTIFRNMLSEIGFATVQVPNKMQLYGSNDLSNWTLIQDFNNSQVTVTLDSTTGFFKYYKTIQDPSISNVRFTLFTLNSTDFKAIVFDIPPASGDVITADYHTPYIAKDENHVLDITLTLQFGEYNPTP